MKPSSRRTSAADRALLIELARTRAALERRNLVRDAERLGRQASPRRVLEAFLPGWLGRASRTSWVPALPGLLARYPLLASSLTTLLAVSPRGRWWRVGAALWMGWRWWQGQQQDRPRGSMRR